MDNDVRSKSAQLMTWGYLATFAALMTSGFVTYRTAQVQVQLDEWVSHTHEVLNRLQAVRSSISDAESGQRGYVITGRPEYLRGYGDYVREARSNLDAVAALTVDNPDQQDRLPALRTNLEAKIAEMDVPLRARKAGLPSEAAERVGTGRGQRLMESIRAEIRAMQAEEERLLLRRRANAARADRTFLTSLALGTLASLGLLSGLFAYGKRLTAEQAARRQDDAEHRAELEGRVEERTAELQAINENLESFSYSVSHDLRGPLRNIGLQAALLEDDLPNITPDQEAAVDRIKRNVKRMSSLMDDLLKLSRSTRGELRRTPVDLSAVARTVLSELALRHPREDVTTIVADGLTAMADASMVSILLDNLLRNAWKYSRDTPNALIEVGQENGAYFVRDNGAGFDDAHFQQALEPFTRLHSDKQFEGSGIGLAICYRILARHGGRLWAKSQPGEGATIFFTLGDSA